MDFLQRLLTSTYMQSSIISPLNYMYGSILPRSDNNFMKFYANCEPTHGSEGEAPSPDTTLNFLHSDRSSPGITSLLLFYLCLWVFLTEIKHYVDN